jgi:hypothetical protein
MSVSLAATTNVLLDRYKCLENYARIEVADGLSAKPGFFRFGEDLICYGRTATGFLQSDPTAQLYDVLPDVIRAADHVILPFDLDEVADNLRFERYTNAKEDIAKKKNAVATLIGKAYYLIRPLMPVWFRKHLQRAYLSGWDRIPFPSWPVDRTVENIFERTLALCLEAQGIDRMPFIWFWPEGYTSCMMMTHDIETESGRAFSLRLADIDASFGIKSSFQVVPEERYAVWPAFLDALRAKGCEINVHGDNHDGRLFRERNEFLRRAERINRYAKEFRTAGFRSPVLYRNADWFDALDFSYDMSFPVSAHLEPQRGGCCTVMPYFIGDMLELPLTMTQDYSLFHIINERSIGLWKQEIDLVMEKHGLVSFNTHPDYIMDKDCIGVYRELLGHISRTCTERVAWMALPGEVDAWWRQRREMELISEPGGFRIHGPSSERAVVAYARVKHGRIVYEFPNAAAMDCR